jgi:hypothetical protein
VNREKTVVDCAGNDVLHRNIRANRKVPVTDCSVMDCTIKAYSLAAGHLITVCRMDSPSIPSAVTVSCLFVLLNSFLFVHIYHQVMIEGKQDSLEPPS